MKAVLRLAKGGLIFLHQLLHALILDLPFGLGMFSRIVSLWQVVDREFLWLSEALISVLHFLSLLLFGLADSCLLIYVLVVKFETFFKQLLRRFYLLTLRLTELSRCFQLSWRSVEPLEGPMLLLLFELEHLKSCLQSYLAGHPFLGGLLRGLTDPHLLLFLEHAQCLRFKSLLIRRNQPQVFHLPVIVQLSSGAVPVRFKHNWDGQWREIFSNKRFPILLQNPDVIEVVGDLLGVTSLVVVPGQLGVVGGTVPTGLEAEEETRGKAFFEGFLRKC